MHVFISDSGSTINGMFRKNNRMFLSSSYQELCMHCAVVQNADAAGTSIKFTYLYRFEIRNQSHFLRKCIENRNGCRVSGRGVCSHKYLISASAL